MVEIEKSQEVNASIDFVWKLVSDLDNEHKSWSFLKDVKQLRKTENSIEREAKVRRGPMGEAKSLQTLTIHPSKKSTELSLTKGPMLGARKIALSDLGDGRTKIDLSWKFEMKGVPGFEVGFVKDNLSEVTEKSLKAIAQEAEKISHHVAQRNGPPVPH